MMVYDKNANKTNAINFLEGKYAETIFGFQFSYPYNHPTSGFFNKNKVMMGSHHAPLPPFFNDNSKTAHVK